MAASTLDKITDVRNAGRPNPARATGTRSVGGNSLACDNLTGWPTASKVHFVTYKLDSSSNIIAGSQLDCSGIVSGNSIASFTVIDGTDVGNTIGDVVVMLPTAAYAQDLASALTLEHDRTGAHTAAFINTIKSSVLGTLYPVGSIYTNATVSTNPATLLGFGTWAAFGGGRVLIGDGTSDAAYAAGATGGESTHVLTTTELAAHSHGVTDPGHSHGVSDPGHSHNLNAGVHAGGGGVDWTNNGGTQKGSANLNWSDGTNTASAGTGVSVNGNTTGITTNNAGSGTAHNNLQPYVVVYMWRRTA